ncbi:integrase core domain-containing protein [Phocaeicola plebeius]|uniref:integrase core domain-containing protein n=1 Tax=Bacteroidaceae TaxID=815 RepID=UPI002A914965|nr:integrase core domain-containing protein [Phocaeicola plebeius]MDY5977346.1 integrase core domain-containing protein [Phocaeicola plebeius]
MDFTPDSNNKLFYNKRNVIYYGYKTERIYRQSHFNNINHARNVIDRYIHFYNNYRPHMSIGYKNTGSGASGRGRTEKDVETGKIH